MAKPKGKKSGPELDFVLPEDGIFTTYANNVMVGYTPFDVRMIFGEIVEVDLKRVEIEQRAHVTVSWIQAKILRDYLAYIIQKQENEVGEIKLPEGVADPALSAKSK